MALKKSEPSSLQVGAVPRTNRPYAGVMRKAALSRTPNVDYAIDDGQHHVDWHHQFLA
jgi:hypothetical protein